MKKPTTRRGTVLVLILGALALISVVTLVYVTIGQSDRRASAVTVRNDQVETVVGRLADYAAGIIANAALATYVDGVENNAAVLVRRAADWPFTDPLYHSSPSAAQSWRRFDPTGSHSEAVTGVDNRIAGSPYLASTRPTWLQPTGHTIDDYQQFRDWYHISNIAPDGRFVNLYNLRNNFEARPGAGAGFMSFGLSLVAQNGTPTQALPFGAGIAQANVPSHWTNFQQYAYRTTSGIDWNPAVRSPGNIAYPHYQWADADGDGFFDSRWFMLDDATDPANIRSLLPRDGRFRWFAAVRITDLSANINVNTATEFRTPPRAARRFATTGAGTPYQPADTDLPILPIGRTPGDVDLRRALMMTDSYFVGLAAPYFGYQLLWQRPGTADPYRENYNAPAAVSVGRGAYTYLHRWLRPSLAGQAMSADDRLYYYEDFGSQPGASLQGNPGAQYLELARLFGTADLQELLTYRTINSPNSARIEEVLGGQGIGISPAAAGRLSPLRDNRDLGFETRDTTLNEALARSFFDVRQLLTSASGARPLRSTILPNTAYRTGLNESLDVQVDAYAALRAAAPVSAASADPSKLFLAYADALLPHSWRTNAWLPARWTLHYGYHPEVALRAAAHMAANMAASYERSNEPRPYTLLIDESFRTIINNPAQRVDFPWWHHGAPTRHRLDLTTADTARAQRLSPSAQSLSARAINIYGIEAQPFITQVVAVHIYSDAPVSAGGDFEGLPTIPPPPTGDPRITIAGGLQAPPTFPTPPPHPRANPDFLGTFIAFQLTNPFDVEIELTNPTGSTGYPDYYIQFGSDPSVPIPEHRPYLFRLADYRNNPAGAGTNIKLRPGETRVAVVMSNTEQQLVDKWRAINPALPTSIVREFIDHQFSIEPTVDPASSPTYYQPGEVVNNRVRPWIIRAMDPTTGLPRVPEPTFGVDFFTSSNGHDNGTVYLWRTIEDGPFAMTDPEFRRQHLLADRLRDPAVHQLVPTRPTLDRAIPNGNNEIAGTVSALEGRGDNTGFTIALWGSIRRVDNPDNGTNLPLGAIPAYCIEAKWSQTRGGLSAGLVAPSLDNLRDTDGVGPGSLSRTDFTSSPSADTTFSSFVTKVTTGPALVPDITERPWDRTSTTTTTTIGSNLDLSGTPRTYRQLYPEIILNNRYFDADTSPQPTPRLPILRVGDMLSPLAIGPSFDPSVNDPNDPYAGWITLGEALALALNYSIPTPPASQTNPGPFGILHRIGDTTDPTYGVLDRGNLMLDKFIPHDLVGGTVQRRFPGIPLALNILNTFRVAGDEAGSLTRSTPGLININTAPLQVMRTVPMLSPSVSPPENPSHNWEWEHWLEQAGITSTLPPLAVPTMLSDMAAAAVAYRDKIPVFDRGFPVAYPQMGIPQTPPRINRFTNVNGHPVFDPANNNGRAATTGMFNASGPLIREMPGFATRGEIMAIVTDGTSNPPRLPLVNSMNVLANDDAASGLPGLVTTAYNRPAEHGLPTVPRPRHINEIPDSFDEQLLIANAALGSITVRSDVFAVWMLLHGYQRSDTENLGPDDPLVPTIAKRYLMVVDRSNVTRKGQQPRILLFKEVPLR